MENERWEPSNPRNRGPRALWPQSGASAWHTRHARRSWRSSLSSARSIFCCTLKDFSFSHSLPSSSTNGAILVVVGVLGDPSVARVFSLDFLGARGVELLPSSKSSSVSTRVISARVPFLSVLSGLANLGFPGRETGGGDKGEARIGWPFAPKAPEMSV
jgi:hypothetical protein